VKALERTQDYLNLGEYSANTARNYLAELRWLFACYPDTKPSQLTRQMTLDYLLYCSKTLGCSKVKNKMAANAFAFFFRQVLQQPYLLPNILFKAHSARLPSVMSTEEIKTIIDSIANIKHRAVMSFLYSTGMRLNEVACLKIKDIDSMEMRVKVVAGKGKKDRYTLLSYTMLSELRAYWIADKPKEYLFNGKEKGKKYSARSIQHILAQALIKTGLTGKHYTIHTFRHSFATHLLNNGTDLMTIKELLGHSSLQQTMKYLHLSDRHTRKVINPYDLIQEKQTLMYENEG
jgi:site-specific recombinase XerD